MNALDKVKGLVEGWLDPSFVSRHSTANCAKQLSALLPELEAMARDGVVLDNARICLPTRVKSNTLGDWDDEKMSIFDAGYNAALDRAHTLLRVSPDAILKARARDTQGGSDEA